MSCIRLSSFLQVSSLRSATVRTIIVTSQYAKDQKDDNKPQTKSVSELMNALKGLKVDGVPTEGKKKIGFSAAAEFKKRKLQKIQTPKKAATESESVSKSGSVEVEDKVKEAAVNVAKAFPDQQKTESELLQQLLRVKDATTAGASGQELKDVSTILSGIKVQKQMPQGEHKQGIAFDSAFGDGISGSTFRDSTKTQEDHPKESQKRKTLFDRQRLNIFYAVKAEDKQDAVTVEGAEPSIWEVEAEKAKKESLVDTIRNGFDEMIQLTEEGKLWKYPIDNERGLEEEQKVPFYEHVFLEQHLEGFPDIPEVLNFMELVIIGLGKNPYLTVQQKKEHIEWFRTYFENKLDILKENSISS